MAIETGLMLWSPMMFPADNFWTVGQYALANCAIEQAKINSLSPSPNDNSWSSFANIYKEGDGYRDSWRRYIEWDGFVSDRLFGSVLTGEATHFEKPAMGFALAFNMIDIVQVGQSQTQLIQKGTAGVDYVAHVTINADFHFHWNDVQTETPTGFIEVGSWYFMIASGDASGMWMSIKKAGDTAWTSDTDIGGTPTYSSGGGIRIGQGFGGTPIPVVGSWFHGKMQHLMIWDAKKDQSEMESGIEDFIGSVAVSSNDARSLIM